MWIVCLCESITIFCVMQQPCATDVIIAALFVGSAWELSALVTERSHRKMEELFETPVSVTATLLIYVWAARSESQWQSEPKERCLSAWLVEAEVSAAHIVVERESRVWFVGAVSTEAKFSCCSLSHSAGADEVTEALADCCCSVSGGPSAHCKLGAHRLIRERCVLS